MAHRGTSSLWLRYLEFCQGIPSLRGISSKPIKKKGGQPSNRQYQLSAEQKEALVGIILGDGFLERAKPTHNTRLAIDQGYPEKEEYVNSLFELFKPMLSFDLEKPKVYAMKPHKKTSNVYQSIRFKTLVHPCLNQYHDLFYKNNKKVVPANLEELLTARGLAYWIMDDGSKTIHGQTKIHTESFTKTEVEFIQSVLKQKFNLNTRIEQRDKNKRKDQWIIYIQVTQDILLKDIVGPYMHKSMLYKI